LEYYHICKNEIGEYIINLLPAKWFHINIL
jgi:hypothetical protein